MGTRLIWMCMYVVPEVCIAVGRNGMHMYCVDVCMDLSFYVFLLYMVLVVGVDVNDNIKNDRCTDINFTIRKKQLGGAKIICLID